MTLTAMIQAKMEARLPVAMQRLGDAWAAETKKNAPIGPAGGGLVRSVRFVMTGSTTGELRMRFYGRIVATITPTLSGTASATAARRRYASRVGRVIRHPNPFYARAYRSSTVQAVRQQMPHLVFGQGGITEG